MKQGIDTFPSGSWYKGEFDPVANKKDGEGTFFWMQQEHQDDFFSGKWKNGEKFDG